MNRKYKLFYLFVILPLQIIPNGSESDSSFESASSLGEEPLFVNPTDSSDSESSESRQSLGEVAREDAYSIDGTFYDSTRDAPVPNIYLTLPHHNTTTTRTEGHFEFIGIDGGPQTISFNIPTSVNTITGTLSPDAIIGSVRDSEGNYLGGIVRIKMIGPVNANGQRTIEEKDTGDDGLYAFTLPLPGRYQMTFNLPPAEEENNL